MTLRPNGEILISYHKSQGCAPYYEYGWEGGPIIGISHKLLRQSSGIIRWEGNFLDIGPYHLRILVEGDAGHMLGGYEPMICVREGPRAWGLALRVWGYNLTEKVLSRVLATLTIWGLRND